MSKSYSLVFFAVFSIFTLVFLLFFWLDFPFLSDPSEVLEGGGGIAALISWLLLASDIFLPIPSSILMIGNGALFGVLGGALLSVLGGLCASLIGFYLGRKGAPVFQKYLSPTEQDRAEQLIKKWGSLAIILTRPMPLLAETVSIMAGASSLSWQQMMGTSFLGLLPPAILYAFTGVYSTDLGIGFLSFFLVIGVAGIFWLGSRWLQKGEEEL